MADILLELPAFDQLFGPNIENKRAIRTAQHTLDLVDADVAVLCCFSGSQRHFQMDRTLDMLKFKCWYYEQAMRDGSEDRVHAMLPDHLPPDIQPIYDHAHET